MGDFARAMGHFTAEGLKQLRKRASKLGQKKPSLCEPVFEAWADFFIDLIPLWVAPSLITFVGLLCLFSGYAAFYFVQMTRDNQADFGTEPPPQWACFFAAGTFLAYTTFNSLDEKQADRTGSGSALSDIFNIACDAIAMCLVTISISSVTMLGISTETIVLFCIIEFSYYISHWRHYHCGTGADSIITIQEGLAAVMAMCLVSAFNPMIWKNDMSWLVAPFKEFPACPEEGCFQLNHLMVYALLGYSIFLNVTAILGVHAKYSDVEGEYFFNGLQQLLPAFLCCGCTIVWATNSPTQLYARHPHWLFLGIGLVLGNLCVRLVTSNMSKQRFSIYPYMVTLLLLCTILSVTGCYGTDQDKNKEEEICLAWFFAMGVWNFYNLTKNVCFELSSALDLGIFVLKKTRTN